jgi:hypothetical protein
LTVVDGIPLNDEDRVLLKGQTDPIENGLYAYESGTQLLSRITGIDAELFSGMTVTVEEGTSADSMFVLETENPITIGVTPIIFSMLAGSAVDGEANTGSNVGGGSEVFKQKSALDLEFRTLEEGANITLTPGIDTIEVASSGGGGVTPSWGRMGRLNSVAYGYGLSDQVWIPWSNFDSSYVIGGNLVTFSGGSHPAGDYLVIGSSGAGIYRCHCSFEFASRITPGNLDFRFLINGTPSGAYMARAGDGVDNARRHVSLCDFFDLSPSDTVAFGVYKRSVGAPNDFAGIGVVTIRRVGT